MVVREAFVVYSIVGRLCLDGCSLGLREMPVGCAIDARWSFDRCSLEIRERCVGGSIDVDGDGDDEKYE